jgi:hypothetical protein
VLISHLLGVDPVPWAAIRFTRAHTGIHRLRTTRRVLRGLDACSAAVISAMGCRV